MSLTRPSRCTGSPGSLSSRNGDGALPLPLRNHFFCLSRHSCTAYYKGRWGVTLWPMGTYNASRVEMSGVFALLSRVLVDAMVFHARIVLTANDRSGGDAAKGC